MIKFFYNGIKTNDSKQLQKAFYTQLTNSICVTCDDYKGFSKEVREQFTVIDNTDIMTDYFEKERFEIPSMHCLYNKAKIALLKNSLKPLLKRFNKKLLHPKGLDKEGLELRLKIEEHQEQIKTLEKL